LRRDRKNKPAGPAGSEGAGRAAATAGGAYWFTCTTFAGGKPLKYVEEAWL
jgi:hypothetical protein